MVILYFFDVPVYRLPEDKYYADRERSISQTMEENGLIPDSEHPLREYLEKEYGGPWQYNEIIGHIRLHFLGSQVRGEYFRVDAKMIVRTRKKTMYMESHKLVPELQVPDNASSAEIFAIIIECFGQCGKKLRWRYVDVSLLKAIGPYVDWRRMWDAADYALRPTTS